VGIDLALHEGRPDTALEGCRQAIARETAALNEPYIGTLLLRQGWAQLAIGDRVGATQAAHRAQDLLSKQGHRARHTEATHLVALLALGRGQARTARVLLDPMITAARAFGMANLVTIGTALKLRVAAAMNDKVAARTTLSAVERETQEASADWRLARSRWQRVQQEPTAACATAVWGTPRTPAAVFLKIEAARLLLATSDIAGAREQITEALTVSNRRGFLELRLLAQLVAGAIDHDECQQWPNILQEARRCPWVELSLTALAMTGRRALRRGDVDTARAQFEILLRRADHIDHHYHRVVANEALVQL
jgi:hypothetical protein